MSYENLKGQVMRIKKKKVFYFDSEGIYNETSIEKAREMQLKGLKSDYYKLGEYCTETDFSGATARAILSLNVGDTIEKLEKEIKRFESIEKNAEKSNDYKNKVFRVKSNKLYFFNEKGEWTCLPEKEALVADIALPFIWFEKGKDVKYCPVQFSLELLHQLNIDNKIFLVMAIKKLKIGDSIEKLQEYYNGATLSKKTPEPIWEGIVTKVCIPEFRCKPENPNKTSTFDYIIVDVNLVTTWEGDKKKYIEEHKKGISKLVLEKINKNRTFKRHNVPINYLKISKITLCKDRNVLQYVLELKPI